MKKQTKKFEVQPPRALTLSGPGTRWTPEELEIFEQEEAVGGGNAAIADRVSQRIGRMVTRDSITHVRGRVRERAGLLTPAVTTASGPKLTASQKLEDAAVKELEMVKRLVTLTKKPATLESLCNVLDVSPARLRSLADAAKKNGYRVHIEGDSIGRAPSAAGGKAFEVLISKAMTKHTIAIVGDIHIGSKYHLGAQLKDFCDKAFARGARHFLHVGDLLDGVYKHSRWDQSEHGFEEQSQAAIETLPRYKGAQWYFIAGNHDETFADESGIDVGRAIADRFRSAGRNDLTYLGARGAYMRLHGKGERRGLFVELWHPRGGSAYAKSYRAQKKVEGYSVGAKPDILAIGHFHQSMYLTVRGVHAISAGCWQGSGSSFAKSLGGAPDIGSWIVEYSLTKEGTVRDISPTWVSYFETEKVREVALG